LADLSVEAASALADDVAVDEFAFAPEPDYELWRARVRAHFVTRLPVGDRSE